MINPKVSIIIPVFGVEEYISTCITSVIKQNYKNMEVLIIDDCTKDNSVVIANDIIKKYDGEITFKLVKHTKNRKQAGARNTGLNIATGEYIFFLDSDDELIPDAIGSLVKEAISSGADITTANRKVLDWNTHKIYKVLEADYQNMYFEHIDEANELQIHGTVWNKLIKRSFIIDKNLYFEEGILYEDDLWMYKLYCARPSICCISNFTYIYYIRPSSTMQTFTELHLFSKIIVAQRAIQYLPNVEKSVKGYACYMAENFRQGALMSCVENVTDIKSYIRIYHFLRRFKIARKEYFSTKKLSTMAKLRFQGYLMPTVMGQWWNYLFIKLILKKTHYNSPYLRKSKMNLTDMFWLKLQDI